MPLAFTSNEQTDEELNQFRREVRQFIRQELTPEIREEMHAEDHIGARAWAFINKLGERGWISIGWPERFGGMGKPLAYRLALWDELAYAGAPGNLVANRIVAPVLMQCANPDQQAEFLPRIAAETIEFALGYTEPNAGSDLSAITTTAVLDGDQYRINGEKMFNTGCHFSHYHWLLARTDRTVPARKSSSLFIVDMDSPGIELRPLYSIAGERTNAVFYSDVVVPRSRMVGEPNKGFAYLRAALAFERLFLTGDTVRSIEDLIAYCRANEELWSDAAVRQELAALATDVEVTRQFAFELINLQEQERPARTESSVAKVYSTEAAMRLTRFALRILGHRGELIRGSADEAMHGRMIRQYRRAVGRTIVGGTTEIQLDTIATGVGLQTGRRTR